MAKKAKRHVKHVPWKILRDDIVGYSEIMPLINHF